jgi:hypothetical protein
LEQEGRGKIGQKYNSQDEKSHYSVTLTFAGKTLERKVQNVHWKHMTVWEGP